MLLLAFRETFKPTLSSERTPVFRDSMMLFFAPRLYVYQICMYFVFRTFPHLSN